MDKIIGFVNGPYNNLWLEYPHLRVYVRKGIHLHPRTKEVINCFDVANIDVDKDFRNSGLFTEWMAKVRTVCTMYQSDFQALYVENVLTQRLKERFIRMDWVETSHSVPSFFLFPHYPVIIF